MASSISQDFTGALFGWTVVGHVYLNRITGIGQIRHAGPSYISTSTLEFTAHEVAKSGVIRTDRRKFALARVLFGIYLVQPRRQGVRGQAS